MTIYSVDLGRHWETRAVEPDRPSMHFKRVNKPATAPEADTPVNSTVRLVVTEPTAPKASTPVKSGANVTSTLPTAPEASTPVVAICLSAT